MNLGKNIGFLYYLSPFLTSHSIVENKLSLILAILFGFKKITIKLKSLPKLSFDTHDFTLMYHFVGSLTFSASYKQLNENSAQLSFDLNNSFVIPLTNFSKEDKNLIETLFLCVRAGADFITDNNKDISKYRKKTLKIFVDEGKKIIETFSGVKFYLDSINAGNTIMECFIDDIHAITDSDDWSNKIVVDVGAECGDTPLYYASKGAKVYAFEPIKPNFDAMLRNMSLNPNLSANIIPINAAVGKDGKLNFFQAPDTPNIGSSFTYNRYGENALQSLVDGISFSKILEAYKIKKIDLLKMDCKGCEMYLNASFLEHVDEIKIEYVAQFTSHKFEDIKKLLEDSGFVCMVYRNSQFARLSNRLNGHIYGKKTHTSKSVS